MAIEKLTTDRPFNKPGQPQQPGRLCKPSAAVEIPRSICSRVTMVQVLGRQRRAL